MNLDIARRTGATRLIAAAAIAIVTTHGRSASAFCGFYIAKADAKLYNKASKVVLVRDGDRTVLTMANDFKGDPKEFAVVIPVPTVLEREQIHVGDIAVVDHLDAFTAPRLVEYFDPDPCARPEPAMPAASNVVVMLGAEVHVRGGRSLSVTVEARYTVGEYDILILSARESDGLERWLRDNGYRVPEGASRVLDSYLKQGMKFFVAKVNLEQQSALGYQALRPLQIAYESPKFMLPIRLGMTNADGAQELFVFALTRQGRVETTNYRTVRLPSGDEIPPYVKADFQNFYRSMFTRQVEKEDMNAVFLEHAWSMGSCDPCAAEPLSADELRKLGVFWADAAYRPWRSQGQGETFVTRLHVRYDAKHFPEDLAFQVTGDRENFQGRYVLRHPFEGACDCDAGRTYRRDLRQRQEDEAQRLAALTGWDLATIRTKLGLDANANDRWWRRVWQN